jgi:membrane protease YdiL (CAAX protease family)
LEGSLCSLVVQVGCTVLLAAAGHGPVSVVAALPALVAGVVLEAVTLQVDNLVVPPIVFAMLSCAEGQL